MTRNLILLFTVLFLLSCEKESLGTVSKLTYKRIETKDYFLEGYIYINNTNKIFPNELVLIDKNKNDTIYHCKSCYRDFHMILEDTLLIYGGNKLDSIIDNKIILKKIPVPQEYRYNLPFK
ncbi:hypothetical protein [Chryseobacterium aurantiacum]|uniref:hypothetical protein n=1 Tax=Chryseobacterium aurantiacum TaxID=2116499 RepID=UPI000D1245BF|nr:hypothetical protein [Chryseobacterium aurantiacum]